jgi:hypothetical protein
LKPLEEKKGDILKTQIDKEQTLTEKLKTYESALESQKSYEVEVQEAKETLDI